MIMDAKANAATKPNTQRKLVRELKNLRRSSGDKSSSLNRCHPPCHLNRDPQSAR